MQVIPEPKDPIQQKPDGQYVPTATPRPDPAPRTFISEWRKILSGLREK